MSDVGQMPSKTNPFLRAGMALVIFAVLTGALFSFAGLGAYNWIKAFHVIFAISWMAGMLYLPRLFAYHVAAPIGSQQSETFKIMERRLMRGIINPAMMGTWIFGLWLASRGFDFAGGWLHAKISLVVLLSAIHGYLAGGVRRFAEDRNEKSARFWKVLNEMPALLMIGIVILVIVKPF